MKINDAIENFFVFLAVERGVSKNTISSYKEDMNQFLNSIKCENIEELKEDYIEDFIMLLSKKGKAPSTIIRKVITIRQFYKYLQNEKLLINKASIIPLPKKEEHLRQVLTQEEIEALFDVVPLNKKEGIRNRAMLEVMYSSGLRVSELLNLEKSSISSDYCFLKINGKGNKQRLVPLGEYAKNYLLKYENEVRNENAGKNTKYLFLNKNGGQITRQYFWKMVKKYAEDASITKTITPHTLRHSFATHLLDNGCPLSYVQYLLGHENIVTTQIYTHVTSEHILENYDLYNNKK